MNYVRKINQYYLWQLRIWFTSIFVGESWWTAVTGTDQKWCHIRHHIRHHHGTEISGCFGLCRLQRAANSSQTCQGELANVKHQKTVWLQGSPFQKCVNPYWGMKGSVDHGLGRKILTKLNKLFLALQILPD